MSIAPCQGVVPVQDMRDSGLPSVNTFWRVPERRPKNRKGAGYFPPSYRGEPFLVPKLLAGAGYHCGLVGKLDRASDELRREERADNGFRYRSGSRSDSSKDLDRDYRDAGSTGNILRWELLYINNLKLSRLSS